MIHSSQIIVGEDLSIRYAAVSTSSFLGISIAPSFMDLETISSYSLSMAWQTKDTIPVNSKFEQTAKVALKETLNLTALTDKKFEMPDPYVWIEIGLLIKELANGDRWQWNRTAKYLITNDTQTQKLDDMVQHQYTMLSQGKIISERVLIPATKQVFWQAPLTADLQVMTDFKGVEFIKIL